MRKRTTTKLIMDEIHDKYLYPLANTITKSTRLSGGEAAYDTRKRSTIVSIKSDIIHYYSKFEDHYSSTFEEVDLEFPLSDPKCFDKLIKQFIKHHG